jgi:hypothetical protein
MNNIKDFIEGRVFGVCTRIGEILGIPSITIRKMVGNMMLILWKPEKAGLVGL